MDGLRWRQLLPCVLAMTWPGLVYGYYGVLIGSLSTLHHDVSGDVYARDESTLFIKNFTFDGNAPDAHFAIGTRGAHGPNPSASGRKVPMPDGSLDPLGLFSNTDIVLELPGVLVTDLLWLSVYCIQAGVDFGSLSFPQSPVITPPAPKSIGAFRTRAHGVRCDDIIVQDTKTFHIKNLHYDGLGPDAFFLVGTGAVSASGTKVPNERGSLGVLGGYNGQDITIRLPGALTMSEINWLSIYCITYTHNFGEVFLPATLSVPPAPMTTQDDGLSHCEALTQQLQVSWEVADPFITVELNGYIGEGQYMAFGLSGATDRSAMVNADVFVVSLFMNGSITVTDYFLSSYQQCTGSANPGVCSDTTQGGNEDIETLETSAFQGVVRARFKRRLDTGDSSTDKPIQTASPMYVVWAKGGLNEFGVVTKHSERLTGNLMINFGRTDAGVCNSLVAQSPRQLPGWRPHHIRDVTVFEARIGPAGLSQGYKALTGHTSWGIVWYINGIIIPELYVERNKTYTFRVEGGGVGANGSDVALHHPFYITDDPKGGYYQQSEDERQRHRVYAGIEDGIPTSNAVGPFCEYEATQPFPENGYPTFERFASTLRLSAGCQNNQPGILTWKPDEDTPDLVYYQCYSHRFFGWKIHVTDNGTSGVTGTTGAVLVIVTLVVAALLGF